MDVAYTLGYLLGLGLICSVFYWAYRFVKFTAREAGVFTAASKAKELMELNGTEPANQIENGW